MNIGEKKNDVITVYVTKMWIAVAEMEEAINSKKN